MFIDREEELSALEKLNNENKAQLIIFYGRRRVGKTALLQEFIKNKKNSLFFMSDISENILSIFSRVVSEKFRYTNFDNWDDFFDFLFDISQNERFIVVIDEFQYLYTVLKAWPTILQRKWEKLKNSKILLILSGSLISSINKISLGYGSALYGRKTGEIELKPLKYYDSIKFFNGKLKEKIEAYMILGGVPRYLEEFTYDNIDDNILDKILNKNSYLYNEPLNILYEEFRDFSSYFSVLYSIASGSTRFNEISDKSKIAQNKLSKILMILERSGIIKKEESLIKNSVKNKSLYYIKDNYFSYWFNFIYPNRSALELEDTRPVLKNIKEQEHTFYGKRFELLSREIIIQKRMDFPFIISNIGYSWGKLNNIVNGKNTYEFDITFEDFNKKNIAIFEVKYKTLDYLEAIKIIKEKMDIYNNLNLHRKALFGIIAYKIIGKEKIENFYAYDYRDLNL